MSDYKNNLRGNITSIIEKISNIDFQKDVWIEGKYFDQITHFGEAINSLDDFLFFDMVKYNFIRFDDIENQKKLICFTNNLLEYDEYKVFEMLKDKYWLVIVKEAKEIYMVISNLIIDELDSATVTKILRNE